MNEDAPNQNLKATHPISEDESEPGDRSDSRASVTRYWRDPIFEQGCASERTDISAPEPSPDIFETFEDNVADLVSSFETAARITSLAHEILQPHFEREARSMACALVRESLLLIADSKVGKTPEFRALLTLFSPEDNAQKIASEAGLSRQSVEYHLRKIAPKFCALTALVEANTSQKNESKL